MKKSTINYLSGDRKILFGYRDDKSVWIGTPYWLSAIRWEDFLKMGKIAVYATSHYDEFKASKGYLKDEEGKIKPVRLPIEMYYNDPGVPVRLTRWKYIHPTTDEMLRVFLGPSGENIFVGETFYKYVVDCLEDLHPIYAKDGCGIRFYDDMGTVYAFLCEVRLHSLEEKVVKIDE